MTDKTLACDFSLNTPLLSLFSVSSGFCWEKKNIEFTQCLAYFVVFLFNSIPIYDKYINHLCTINSRKCEITTIHIYKQRALTTFMILPKQPYILHDSQLVHTGNEYLDCFNEEWFSSHHF